MLKKKKKKLKIAKAKDWKKTLQNMDNNLNLPSNSSTELLTDLVLEEEIWKTIE